MLHDLYTTQMSTRRNALQLRFATIQQRPTPSARWAGPLLFALLLALMVGVSACMAEETEATTGETTKTFATAVLLEDATLEQCCFLTLEQGEDGQVQQATSPVADEALHQGDLVLVLEETGETARVLFPSGDTPTGLCGTLPASVLSQEEADLQKATLADASGVMASQSIQGPETEELLGLVRILDREDGWCQVQPFAGGDTRTFWVPEDALTFSLYPYLLDPYGSHEQDAVGTELYEQTVAYLDQEFHRVYDPYYDIQDITLSQWTQEGDEASFLCTMTYLNYERDPEAVAWLQEKKADDASGYDILVQDYLSLHESNYNFKVVRTEDGLALYDDVSVSGGAQWRGPITLDEYIAQ